jgi:hypothetical protein
VISRTGGSSSAAGWAGGPGRPRGSLTRVKADLAQMILNGAAEAGFLETNSAGNLRKASGLDGCQGYLRWCAVNEKLTVRRGGINQSINIPTSFF